MSYDKSNMFILFTSMDSCPNLFSFDFLKQMALFFLFIDLTLWQKVKAHIKLHLRHQMHITTIDLQSVAEMQLHNDFFHQSMVVFR